MSDKVPRAVLMPRALDESLPWLVRTHPERSSRARVTAVRELMVELAAQHPRLLDAFHQCAGVGPIRMVDALLAYRRAADEATEALWLPHRSDLLAREDGPLPIRHDAALLARLPSGVLASLALATATLRVTLDWTAPLATRRLALAVSEIQALAPTTAWLVPCLLRWLHLRWYETLYAADAGDGTPVRTPFEIEGAAVARSPGPTRQLRDRAPREGGHPLAYEVMAWWARRIDGKPDEEVWRWWHARRRDRSHRRAIVEAIEVDGVRPRDCGCPRAVGKALAEVARLLAFRA